MHARLDAYQSAQPKQDFMQSEKTIAYHILAKMTIKHKDTTRYVSIHRIERIGDSTKPILRRSPQKI